MPVSTDNSMVKIFVIHPPCRVATLIFFAWFVFLISSYVVARLPCRVPYLF